LNLHDPFYDLFPRPSFPSIAPGRTALLTIDLQYLDAHADGWIGRIATEAGQPDKMQERWDNINAILPNVRRCQDAFRAAGEEVIHVRVAYRTDDGRDAGKAFMPSADLEPVPRDLRDDDLLPEVAEQSDEMIFSKTSSSVFNSSAIDNVLKRMGITHLVFTGIVTEGCVELSARDAADRGYAVSLVSDACTSSTRELHENALVRMTDGGFIASCSTDEICKELENPDESAPYQPASIPTPSS
jgi:nicotinamidase-related amidase